MNRIPWLLIAPLLLGAATAYTPTVAQSDQADEYIRAEMQKRHIPGLTLAVLKEGRAIKQKAYGMANVELGVPATIDTVYQIASNTKTFTSVAVMLLVEEGKLSLDDKVATLLPGLPASWGGVTVKHCLTHTSGLPDVMVNSVSADVIAETRDEAIKKLAAIPVVSKPGEKWKYIQTGYMLLGMIIEKVAGVSFDQFLDQRIFKPLGMTSTSIADYREIVPRRASLYTRIIVRGNEAFMSPEHVWAMQPAFVYPSYLHTGAGINTTTGDLARWDAALSSDRLLKPPTLEVMWSAVVLADGQPFRLGPDTGYGCGWVVRDRPGHKSVGHSGGASTAYARFLDDKVTVIVLTNLQGSDPDSLVEGVAKIYIPELQKNE